MNQLISDKAVYRTAPATLGLLIITLNYFETTICLETVKDRMEVKLKKCSILVQLKFLPDSMLHYCQNRTKIASSTPSITQKGLL